MAKLHFGLFCLLLLVSAAVASFPTTISDYSPKEGPASGKTLVRVSGCGFLQFSEVTCVWDNKFISPINYIFNDEYIVCEAPIIPFASFPSLPLTVVLRLVFDGTEENTIILGNYVFGTLSSR